MEEKILSDLSQEILNIDNVETVAESLESFVDLGMAEGIAKEIPFVTWAVSAARIFTTVRDKLLFKKLVGFLRNLGDIPKEKREEFQEQLKDKKFRTKVSDTLILILDSINDLHKPNYIGKIFGYAVKGVISFDQFLALSDAVTNTFVVDMVDFEKYAKGNLNRDIDLEKYYRSGISIIGRKIEMVTRVEQSDVEIDFQLSEIGYLLRAILADALDKSDVMDISLMFEK